MRVRLLLLAAAVVPLLAGCTVPSNGWTAIGVDVRGRLLVVLTWCGPTRPDGVTVYHQDERGQVTDGQYVAPRLTGQHASFPLDDSGSDGWELVGAPKFREDIAYTAYGWTEDNSFSTVHVGFRLKDAERLRPGMVLFEDPDVGERIVSRGEFERWAQDPATVQCG